MPIALLEAMRAVIPCLTHPFPVGQWMRGPGGQDVDMSERGTLASAWETLLVDSEPACAWDGTRDIAAKKSSPQKALWTRFSRTNEFVNRS